MENKNYTFIYHDRTYYIIFNNKTYINIDMINFIIKYIKDEYKNCELINKTDKTFKIKIHNKTNFNNFKKFLIDMMKETNKKYRTNIIFNIDINNTSLANIYTLFIIDDNNDNINIKEKIDKFKDELIKNINITIPDYTYDEIDLLIYSSMYNIYFHKLIFTINTTLYENLIKVIYNNKYFNKNNITNFDTYDLYSYEYLNETYIFKEYLTICKNCKEYHKSFYNNEKTKCVFVCSKCDFISEKETFKEHICNVNKILDYCNLCYYYYKSIKKHIPNRGECYNYTQLIKKFVNENRAIAIKNIQTTYNSINLPQIIITPPLQQKPTMASIVSSSNIKEKSEIPEMPESSETFINKILTSSKTDNKHKLVLNLPVQELGCIYELTVIKDKNIIMNITL